jgi:Na+-translocating ferredoxin:NAD+ oxidoreductase subunit C
MTGGKTILPQKVYSFPRGGITFSDATVPSRDSCVVAFLPSLSVIPLIQHSGGRAYPVVSVGDVVKEGMLLARGKGPGSANIHASVPGRIIRMISWKNSIGKIQDGFVIRMEGSFEKLGKKEEVFAWHGMFPYDIQRTISDFGVVEMEGTGRPVSEIISSFRSAPEPITLVASCVFDDPWLAADYVLCKERIAEVAEGAAIVARTCRVSRIVYAVSKTEKELGEAFLAVGEKWGIPIEVVVVGSKYPQRNRRELELVLRNFEKKEGIELGSLFILSPATLAAVYDAVKLRKPVMERYITVGGSAVKRPQIMKVRIGKRIGDIFAECGGFKASPKKIAVGSPLLGQPLSDLDEPVTKTSYAVFALLEEFHNESRNSCINCGECRNVCPVGLDPEELYKKALVSGRNSANAVSSDMSIECHACGCCEIVCPSQLPLSSVISSFALGKKENQ